MMQRMMGPECPHCGVSDSAVVSVAVRRRRHDDGSISETQIERHLCHFCDRRFWSDAAPPVADVLIVAVRCPHCGCRETRVTSTRGRERYHQCGTCQRSFRSVELD